MAVGTTCDTCRFWHRLDPDGESYDADGGYQVTDYGTGRCRRLPPSSRKIGTDPILDDSLDVARTAYWPVTYAEDWCGEHDSPEESF